MKSLALSNLRPITNQSQVDKIESRLQEFFRDEDFLPGDAIPKEMELAKALGVSRTAIREALARFKTLGIIESKKNRGMIITQPDFLANMQKTLHPKLLNNRSLKDLFELRLVLEIGIADLLFLRKTEAYVKKLKVIVEKYENNTFEADRIKYDIEFHSLLYEMSGNETIQRFQKILLPVFKYVVDVNKGLHEINPTKTTDYVTHRDLLDCIKNETAEDFKIKMRIHLRPYFNKI